MTTRETAGQTAPHPSHIPVGGERTATTAASARPALWTGCTLSTIATLFLLMDAVLKLVKPVQVVEGTMLLGYPESSITLLGIILLSCTTLYVVPPTAILGVVLLTGYLGGAIATHLRVENPLFTHTLFPVYIGVLLWGVSICKSHDYASSAPAGGWATPNADQASITTRLRYP